MAQTRRESALLLSEELLADIELSRIPAPEVVKRASRLARLLDDTEAVSWLSQEISGFEAKDGLLTVAGVAAAQRSKREAEPENPADPGPQRYWTQTVDQLQASLGAARLQLQAANDAAVNLSSANPYQNVVAPPGNARERVTLHQIIVDSEEKIGKVTGAVHAYVAEREIELRFGAAVENAFQTVRSQVDAQVAALAPSAATKFAAAFENASSDNPENWANAASACRRLIKTLADELRPPGEPVNGRTMTDDKYVNRLIDWIATQPSVGNTLKDVVTADLEDFGKRIDALDDAGHKGAHAEVTKEEASRFITGAYLLIGDILNLRAEVQAASGKLPQTAEKVSGPTALAAATGIEDALGKPLAAPHAQSAASPDQNLE